MESYNNESIIVVNAKKFAKIDSVNLWGALHRSGFIGTVSIEFKNRTSQEIYGEHGINDYVEEWGFRFDVPTE